MGSRSFNAWPAVEAILDSVPDGRQVWRHKHLPMVEDPREKHGQPVVGRAYRSKSLLINEAVMHFMERKSDGTSCGEIRLNLQSLQRIITEQGEEIERLKKRRGLRGLWLRIFG